MLREAWEVQYLSYIKSVCLDWTSVTFMKHMLIFLKYMKICNLVCSHEAFYRGLFSFF